MIAMMKTACVSISRVFAGSAITVGILIPVTFFGRLPCAFGQVNILTYHNDNARTGQNTNETSLTVSNVNTNTFGLLFTFPVDGDVYAEPLYVSGVAIPGRGTHNVIFAATQNNSVYAFDADNNMAPAGGLLWQTNLGTPALTPNDDFGNTYGPFYAISPHVGITGTPVIDPVSGTLYVNVFTHEGGQYFHRIHALNITNGDEQPYSPVMVTASVPGEGVDNQAGVVTFSPEQQLQRSALTLAGGVLYVCYSSYADTDPYHGWVIGYDAGNLQQLANYVFNTTPNSTTNDFGLGAGEGGIWMSGSGLAVDATTNLFVAVGNGSFNANIAGGTEYGDSIIKFSTSGSLEESDYFTPYNQANLAVVDNDLGSGGVLLLPDSVGNAAHQHLLVAGGKEGTVYLVDRDDMGHFNASNNTQIVQDLPYIVGNDDSDGNIFSSPAYFNNRIYYQGSSDVLKAFAFTNGMLTTVPVSASLTTFGFPGATPVISANGTNNAIVWVLQTDAVDGQNGSSPAILHAYDAYNLTTELYNSGQAGVRDMLGIAVKFAVPTIANGKVYVGVEDAVSVFGNGIFAGNLTLQIAKASLNEVTLSWSPAIPARLQTASALLGTNTVWTDIGTVNPTSLAVNGSNAFFRVVSP